MTPAAPTPFLSLTGADFAAVGPEILLIGAGIVLILLDAFARFLRRYFPILTLAVAASAFVLVEYAPGTYFGGALEASALTQFLDRLALSAVILAVLGGAELLVRDRKDQGEFYAILLWSASGLMLMVKGADLLVVFIGLELMSLGLYVLAAWYRDVPEAVEAGMKYFLTGALASTFLLLGVATLYGRIGTTNLAKMAGLAGPELTFDPLIALGLLCILSALAFKLALVPFQAWAPDVYQGMTTPAVAFLSTAPKAGAAIVLVRLLHAIFPNGLQAPWRPALALLAVLSILFGNVIALAQRDMKRMLAYSGIAQMGYAAIALAAFSADSFEGLLVFMAGYLVTNIAAFLAIAVLSDGERGPHPLADLAGMGRRRPFAASILTLSMLSLTGVPPTIGFLGKLFVFRAAVLADLVPLTIVGVLGSVISAGYYLRVVYTLWMKEPDRVVDAPDEDFKSSLAYLLLATGMLAFGMFPRLVLDMARAAASTLALSR